MNGGLELGEIALQKGSAIQLLETGKRTLGTAFLPGQSDPARPEMDYPASSFREMGKDTKI